jgi:transglutaminase-like putative cysteine protease
MKTSKKGLDTFLESTETIDWEGTEVERKSNELTQNVSNEIEKAIVLFNWVRDEIPHSGDISSDLVTCSATEVLLEGTGICFAKSHLLAGMLRAQKIPAGFCYQALRGDAPNTEIGLHGLNGVYLKSLGKWIRVDPRGNTGSCDAQFSIDEEQLAFTMDSQKGEFIYEEIYGSPAESVVNALNKYESREELRPNLPSSL